jgi:glycosyltransferase involved in cell wall biosynthesis
VVGTNGESASTVDPGDPSALASVLVESLGDEEQRARLGENGRLRVLERFTWRAHAIGLVEMWRAELRERHGEVAHADR